MSFLILIPLVPLLGSVVVALAGRRLGESSHRVAIPAVALSFVLSCAALVQVLRAGPLSVDLYRFVEVDTLIVDLGFYVDQLTVALLLLVTGVSAIVHVYASRYMIGDPRYPRFFGVMGLLTFAMVTLVMSRNLLLTYMCWEVMGICSYLLISHWAHRKEAGSAATKAFLVNAVADVGLGCGVLLTVQTFGTLDIPTILERVPTLDGHTVSLLGWAGLDWSVPTATLLSLLLFTGVMGKSAQLPLHVWLPFAMEAPTAVSALNYAATIVNAGPFLLVRFSPLLVEAPFAMTVIALVGATTALFAALVSMTQSNIKQILAYSTISQIGFVILMCGVGAFAAAVFHLLAHGLLKAFLFLSTGNTLQAVSPSSAHAESEHDGPPSRVSSRSWALTAGTLAFSCIPPAILFSGPYEAMWTLHGATSAAVAFWSIALATVFLTAVYLSRGVAALFRQGFPLDGSIVRPKFWSVPHTLIVLAGALVLMGLLFELPTWFSRFIAPALAQAHGALPDVAPPTRPSAWLVLPFLAAVGGWMYATLSTASTGSTEPARFARPLPARGWTDSLYMLFWNKWYVDELYDSLVTRPNLRFARGLAVRVEHAIVDGALRLLVSATVHTGLWLWRVLEGRGLDRAVSGTAGASVVTARWLWRVLEGRGLQGGLDQLSHRADTVGRFFEQKEVHTLQEHLLLVVGGLAVLLGLFYFSIQRG